jgi:hypothetical protein
MTEGLKQSVNEYLRLAFLIPLQRLGVGDERFDFLEG